MRLTYKATLIRETKNYFVYQYAGNFVLYVPKADFGDDEPSKVANLELSS